MLSDPSKTVVAPGVYDGISTRIALAQGFDCLYMVSHASSKSARNGLKSRVSSVNLALSFSEPHTILAPGSSIGTLLVITALEAEY